MDIGRPVKRTRTYPLTEPVAPDKREPKIAPPPEKKTPVKTAPKKKEPA